MNEVWCLCFSDNYAEPDSTGMKHVFWCAVVCGDSWAGSTEMKRPLMKANGSEYETMVDNTAVVHALSRKWCTEERLMAIIYEICALSIERKFYFWSEWVASVLNVAADALSRFDFKKFMLIAKDFNLEKLNIVTAKTLRYI